MIIDRILLNNIIESLFLFGILGENFFKKEEKTWKKLGTVSAFSNHTLPNYALEHTFRKDRNMIRLHS